ncbi:anaerobic selenocysteine-containing dehydrogenase [Bradyrhizobium sp. LB7.1]
MLIKRTLQHSETTSRGSIAAGLSRQTNGLDRRTFLRRSGLAGGALAALGTLPLGGVREAKAAAAGPLTSGATVRKSICTHCAVGCTVTAEVLNGVWIGQEPSWDSPINRGSHCAKGASVRELVHSERRLRYPMKLVGGQWTRVSWDTAINEIGDKILEVREKSGPDSVYWLGSAKMTNEGSYLFRKLGAFWGTNNTDHQARICHSTTVTGVANTWGYGAMTNSFNDIRNAKTQIIMGGNPRRSTSRIASASARGQGASKGQLCRHRSAPDADRGACDRICAHATGHRYPRALRHDVAHSPERVGG